MSYIYKRTEFSPYELWTVGSHESGKWEPESDHSTRQQAANRVIILNGGTLRGMNQITETQYESLKQIIYDSLIANPENGLGEMGDCLDEAERIADEWMEKENIELIP